MTNFTVLNSNLVTTSCWAQLEWDNVIETKVHGKSQRYVRRCVEPGRHVCQVTRSTNSAGRVTMKLNCVVPLRTVRTQEMDLATVAVSVWDDPFEGQELFNWQWTPIYFSGIQIGDTITVQDMLVNLDAF